MKKREYDVFGILLGIIIGGLLGFFISTRVSASDFDKDVLGEAAEENGFIYLVEVTKYDNATGAATCLENLNKNNISSIYVKRDEYYFVYCGVYDKKENAESNANVALSLGFSETKVVKEYLLDRTNNISGSQSKYTFYSKAIECFLLAIKDENYTLSEDMLRLELNASLLNYLGCLNYLQDASLRMKYKLYVYKELITDLK